MRNNKASKSIVIQKNYGWWNYIFVSLFLFQSFVALAAPISAKTTKTTTKNIHQNTDSLRTFFLTPPNQSKPRVYWWWLFNRVDKQGITRDLEEFKAKGISGVNLICTGGYGGDKPLLGIEWLSPKWKELFRYTVKEAKRLNLELGFNLAGGWTMMGPWVTQDNAMKKLVHSELKVLGPSKISKKLALPTIVDGYYHDICVQAFQIDKKSGSVKVKQIIDLSQNMNSDSVFTWDIPQGEWIILRTGYTLSGATWSKWHAYPDGDTFEGGDGYEIDYLNKKSLDDHFDHLGKLVIEEARKAGGKIDYLWSDSWECGKLTWTQDFFNQFYKYRGYDLKPYLPVLDGYVVGDSTIFTRVRDDFDRTIQDCIADNFYGHFTELCHKNGIKMGSEAAGPNDIPPEDALKNLGRCDIPAGEFWVNGHYKAPNGYNSDPMLSLNLKQTANASHIYGQQEAMAESFTQQEPDRTHWSLGPGELKPYANDAFCAGINRIMLHQATCQPPSDGKPGYEFCAGQHFTPNITWWEQSSAFFTYLSRCQYMLQQGKFVGDVCFYLGERTPTLVPPKYIIPTLGSGYDCDYTNAEVLLTRMSVKNGRIVLPDGMSYRILVLQNCTSPVEDICQKVGNYQRLSVSPIPSTGMSIEVLKKIKQLISDGGTVIGAPPIESSNLKDYPNCDDQVRKLASEIWGDLDGITRTERHFGKGRIIWGKNVRSVLLDDGIKPDFTFTDQASNPNKFDYIHRTSPNQEIYFVTNRTNTKESSDFTFRVSGKQPEIWDAVTGEMHDAVSFQQVGSCTTIPMTLDRFGSYFVVFRKPISKENTENKALNFPNLSTLQALNGSWKVTFDTSWAGPESAVFPSLKSWTQFTDNNIKFYSGKATYHKTFDLEHANSNQHLFLDLGDVHNVAQVRLNGKDLGILWCFPWRVEITDAVKPMNNELEIDVINLWANRVIGDLNLPKEKRVTKTHDTFRFDMLTGKTPLLESGLLGPVTILKE